jgi:hypothetical protein
MNDIRSRLVKALHTSTTLPALREELVLVLCDLADEQEATPTLRSPTLRIVMTDACGHNDDAPETERDSAPPTPVDSQLGQEYGV